MVRVGINGFGSIGRRMLRIARGNPELKVVHINDITEPEVTAHLLRYDSNYGRYPGTVEATPEGLVVDGEPIRVTAFKDPGEIPWGDTGVELVVESTGRFTDAAAAARHLRDGVRKVILSAPGKGDDLTVVMGVNEERYDPAQHRVISNASCTTNCLAPVMKVLLERFGVEAGLMITVHSYTNDQRLLDLPHKDLRRARAAGLNMIPTTTGAAKAIGRVLPALDGKMNGLSVRVPTPTVSVLDVTVVTERPVSVASANAAFREYAQGALKGILDYTEEPVVSMDFKGDPHSAIVDGASTYVAGDHLVKVIAWYDNEWGYAHRLVDLAAYMARRGL